MNKMSKELKSRFLGLKAYALPGIITLGSIVSIKNEGLFYPLIINISIVVLTFLISFWAYLNKIKATAFMIAENARVLMLTIMWIPIQITYPFPNNNIWFIGALLLLVIDILVVLFFENKNWDKRKKSWEESKKIEINKSIFNILVDSRVYTNESRFIFISAFIVPIFVGIVTRFSKAYGDNIETLLIKIVALIGMLLFGILFAQGLTILVKIFQIERKNNIIFKTEYSKINQSTNPGQKERGK